MADEKKNKGNKAGGDKPEITPIDISSELVEGLGKVSEAINKLITDTDKKVDKSVSRTVSKLKSITSELGNMSKVGNNTLVNGNAGQGHKKVTARIADEEKRLAKEAEKEAKKAAEAEAKRLEEEEKRRKEAEKKLSELKKKRRDDYDTWTGDKSLEKQENDLKAKQATAITKLQKDLYQTQYETAKTFREKKKAYDEGDPTVSLKDVQKASDAMEQAAEVQVTSGEKMAQGVIKTISNGVTEIVSKFTTSFKQGMDSMIDIYNNSFTEIAGRTGANRNKETGEYSRKGVTDLYKGTIKEAKQYGGALNINKEVMPQMQAMAKMGLQDKELYQKSVERALDSKLMPWLDNYSESRYQYEKTAGDDAAKTLKGQNLILQTTEAGNRLVQSGVITSLEEDLFPQLTSIAYNTGGENGLSEEYKEILYQLTNNGMSPQEAYQTVQKMIGAEKNQYRAITQGDVATKEFIIGMNEGLSRTGALKKSSEVTDKVAANAGSQIGAGAVRNFLGGWGVSGWDTTESAQRTSDIIGKLKENPDEIDLKEGKKAYEEAADNAKTFDSATNVFWNAVENFGTQVGMFLAPSVIGNFASGFIGMLVGAAPKFVGSLVEKGGTKLLKHFLGGEGGSFLNKLKDIPKLTEKLKNFGSVGEKLKSFSEVGSKALQGGKSLLGGAKTALSSAGVGSTATTIIGAGALVGGAAWMAHDAVKAVKKADDWGTRKSSAGVAGALFGTEDAPSLQNTAKQAGKYALIGAGIGSFIPGVGTAVGAGIGALAGAVSSVVSGKQVAQAIDKARNSIRGAVKQVGDNFKENGLIGGALKTARDGISKATKGYVSVLVGKENAEKLQKAFNAVGEKAKNAVSKAKDHVKDTIKAQRADIQDKGLIGSSINNIATTLFGKRGSDAIFNKDKDKDSKKDKKEEKSTASSVLSILEVLKSINDLLSGNLPKGKARGESSDEFLGKSTVSASEVLESMSNSQSDKFKELTNRRALEKAALMSPTVALANATRDRFTENKKNDKKADENDNAEFENKLIDTIVSVGSYIVGAIREEKNGKVDYENGLLPLDDKRIDSNIVNLRPSGPTTGSIV